MKSFLTFFLSIVLAIAITAPSVAILCDTEQTLLVVDFNEEENNKEDKKELGEQDFFLHVAFSALFNKPILRMPTVTSYTDNYNFYFSNIHVPPPKDIG
ncbi:hypothetical protein [Maribacter sp. 2210JD10-5]|uniref:hypothetical protein n=1 Tax=Maribacter sp. 2210JD10-5 TaxID=3386272 RepID=UPI0039BCE0EE